MTQPSLQPINIRASVEIKAPAYQIFQIIATCERRLQFSANWGKEKILNVSADFPSLGSRYSQAGEGEESSAYETIVTACCPEREFSYRSENNRRTRASWILEELAGSTRLVYEEESFPEEMETEDPNKAAHLEAKEWLNNIKRYCELGEARSHRLLKWVLDRYLLKMRADQRRIIFALIAIQVITFVSFTAAALGLGLISLIF
jgi:hypothetical protein